MHYFYCYILEYIEKTGIYSFKVLSSIYTAWELNTEDIFQARRRNVPQCLVYQIINYRFIDRWIAMKGSEDNPGGDGCL